MQNLTVVMYHYVRPIQQSRYPNIKGLELDVFIKQLDFFKNKYNIVTMEMVLNAFYHNVELPEKSLLLTFDDAYADHFIHVYPILKKYNVQGSFFVPVKTVTENKILDVNKIHFILASMENTSLLISSLQKQLVKYRDEYQLRSFDDYYREFAVANRFDTKDVIFIKRMLQHALPEKLRNIISAQLFSDFVGIDEIAFCKELYMNQYQIEELIRGGMFVGSHGYDHYWWNKLDPDSLTNEIKKSKDYLEALSCDMLNWVACYPYGSSDENVVKVLQEYGCKLAFTTEVRIAQVGTDHPLLIPRLDTNDFLKEIE